MLMESFVPNIFTRVSVMALVLLVRETEDDVDINILYHQYLVCGIAVETPEKSTARYQKIYRYRSHTLYLTFYRIR